MSFDWKGAIKTVAPGVATLLGGPLAGVATTGLLKVFGLESSGDVDKDTKVLASAVQSMGPEHIIEIKRLEADLAVKLREADVNIYKTAVEDKKSARDMQIKTQSYVPAFLAGLVGLTWAGLNTAMFVTPIPIENVDIVQSGMRILDGVTMLVLSFYFGSSVKHDSDVSIKRK